MAPTDRIEIAVSLSPDDRVGLLYSKTLRLDVTDHPAVEAALSAAGARGREQVRAHVRGAPARLEHARDEADTYASRFGDGYEYADGLAKAIDTITAAIRGNGGDDV